ncbi:galactose-specific lectin nattectin-like [Mugil cephalus]|uniref:galactose-specific lectin nattectin-like n=1 Tax=Mugil cephalus TaxID=48193 RepID=UPI001FB8533B|nr:galactose-specific lectin nattectin-like [Mugil cephalus]
MASSLCFIVLLCLTSGLWIEADADSCSTRCPSGWSSYRGRCYLFINANYDWASAERYCIHYTKGNLASVHNVYEYSFLRQLVYSRTRSYRPAWLGGYDAVRNNYWMWSDGSSWNYSPFSRGEPNNTRGGESCMEMNHKGHWANDTKCYERKPFICARNP